MTLQLTQINGTMQTLWIARAEGGESSSLNFALAF